MTAKGDQVGRKGNKPINRVERVQLYLFSMVYLGKEFPYIKLTILFQIIDNHPR
jgi:hypothetical protein